MKKMSCWMQVSTQRADRTIGNAGRFDQLLVLHTEEKGAVFDEMLVATAAKTLVCGTEEFSL